jgi:putative nucleotidyltransferase with HDIG domain
MQISLDRAILSLTGALDFVGIDEVHHAQRVALLAHAIAQTLNWDAQRCKRMLYAGMLHDCGVARIHEHRQLTETLEWPEADQHCIRGRDYLLACPPLAEYAKLIRWHHTRWEALPADLEVDSRLETNLIFLADRLDVLLAPYIRDGSLRDELLLEHPQLIERLQGMAGTLFAPQLVDALRQVSTQEAFWLQCDPVYIHDELETQLAKLPSLTLNSEQALQLAGLFARTVDSKSHYTLEHSSRVARIARHLGAALKLEREHLDMLEIAALLHDIGKLRVSEDIIDKPGVLTPAERAIMKRHSYDTGQILRRVFPGQPIAEWAEKHHENLLGSGYPSRLTANDIPLEARLIAVADIYQALLQLRPYRRPFTPDSALEHLDKMAEQGNIDAAMVALLRQHQHACYHLATGHSPLPTALALPEAQ